MLFCWVERLKFYQKNNVIVKVPKLYETLSFCGLRIIWHYFFFHKILNYILDAYSLSQLKTKCDLQAWSKVFYWWSASYPKLLGPLLRTVFCCWKVCQVGLDLGTLGYHTSLSIQAHHGKEGADSSFHSINVPKVMFSLCKQLCWSKWLRIGWQVANPWYN